MTCGFQSRKSSSHHGLRTRIRDFAGSMVRRFRTQFASDAERLDYRDRLKRAAEAGDTKFIEDEIKNNQLTIAELRRLDERHTPLEHWPEPDDDLLAPETINDDRNRADAEHIARS